VSNEIVFTRQLVRIDGTVVKMRFAVKTPNGGSNRPASAETRFDKSVERPFSKVGNNVTAGKKTVRGPPMVPLAKIRNGTSPISNSKKMDRSAGMSRILPLPVTRMGSARTGWAVNCEERNKCGEDGLSAENHTATLLLRSMHPSADGLIWCV
jgi:hypothetical protein